MTDVLSGSDESFFGTQALLALAHAQDASLIDQYRVLVNIPFHLGSAGFASAKLAG